MNVTTNHVPQLNAGDRCGGGPEWFEPEHRSRQLFDGPMILLNDILEVFDPTDLNASVTAPDISRRPSLSRRSCPFTKCIRPDTAWHGIASPAQSKTA
jgi:hypothetical protein